MMRMSGKFLQLLQHAWSLFFIDGALTGIGLSILPFLIESKCFTNFENASDSILLTTLSGVVFSFYLGKFLGSTSFHCNSYQTIKYRIHFAVISLISVPSLILFGFTSDLIWLISTRFFTGLMAGHAGRLGIILEPELTTYSGWLFGFGLSSIVSGIFYFSPFYNIQVLKTSTKDLEHHPAILGSTLVALLVFLVIVRTCCKGETEEDPNGTRSCYESLSQSDVLSSCRSNRKILDTSNHNVTNDSIVNPLSSSITDLDNQHSKSPQNSKITDNSLNSSRHSNYSEDFDISELQVPSRYIRGCGEYEEALRRWRLTLKWRRDYNVDKILQEPQPHFKIIKECYPHYIHGESKFGQPVYYEVLGKIDIKRLQSNGINVHGLLRYYVFITEYIWNVVEPDQDHGQLVTILDVGGVGMADLMGDALEFLKEASKVIQSHYVERCKKMFIVNAPFFFNLLWRIISPMLHENTRKKISILGVDKRELLEYIDSRQLPEAYGGTGSPLGTSQAERNLYNYVEKLNLSIDNMTESNTTATTTNTTISDDRRKNSTTKVNAKNSSMSNSGLETPSPLLRKLHHHQYHPGHGHENGDDTFDLGESSVRFSLHSRHSIHNSPHPYTQDTTNTLESYESCTTPAGFNFGLGALSSAFGMLSTTTITGVKKLGQIFGSGVSVPEAHLGRENAYIYDQESKLWVLQRDEIAHDIEADDTEVRLVRAIQAAHGLVLDSDFEEGIEEIPLYSCSSSALHQQTGFNTSTSNMSDSPDYEEEVKPTPGYTVLAIIYVLWRGALVSVLESLPAWMFLSPTYKGLGLAPMTIGLIFFSSVCLVLFLNLLYHCRSRNSLSLKGCFPLRALQWAVILQSPVMAMMSLIPFLADTTVNRVAIIVLLILISAVVIACLALATIGTAALAEIRPSSSKSLYFCVHLSESIGGSVGVLLLYFAVVQKVLPLQAMITLPYTTSAGICLLLSLFSLFVPFSISQTNFSEAS